ncbi:MAG: heme exporter protein CcmB [Marinagarivorans sp.]|nr:heme exporter protein CcmB [Marinagarivorans sp.]
MIESSSLTRALWVCFKRELVVAIRHKGELANPLIFFLMVVVFLPLGVSPEKAVLSQLAPGLIWVIALLATLLSLDGLFRSDFEDGSLEQMILSPQPLAWLVLTKMAAHWLITGIPLTLLTPLLGVMLYLPPDGYIPMMISLVIGTGSLSLIGSIGAALTVGLRKGGLILSLVVMPLYVPVLIFGAGAVNSAVEGFPIGAQLAILSAMLLVSLVLAPFAVAGALKISVNS